MGNQAYRRGMTCLKSSSKLACHGIKNSWSQQDGQGKSKRQSKSLGWAWSHLCKVQGKGKEGACCIPLLLTYLHVVTDA